MTTLRGKYKQIFEQACETGYIVAREGTPLPVLNAFYQYCKANRMPYLRVTARRKYARIHFDTFPAGRYFSDAEQEALRAIGRRYLKHGKFYMFGRDGITLPAVPLADVPAVADELLRLVKERTNGQ
ncbi:MAG: hypothetical protein ACPLUL_00345 [Thermanaerothrix sp.]|uniref:hypothetical protein n=1 Tax=Thermanaerothrix sp. TaxID=2972675 RepID=UPI003C7ED21D